MRLNEAQNLFRRNLLAPEADPQALLNLKPAGKLSLQEAFEIYHRGYVSRLTSVLGKTYPAVLWVVGRDLFASLCQRFIEAQPSVSYNLQDYGKNFAEFLSVSTMTVSRGMPFLPDLARFEWTYHEIYHAPSPDPLPLVQVLDLARAQDYKVRFIEAFEIFTSPYAIFELWYRRDEPPYPFQNINWNHRESLLIFKKRGQIQVLPLEKIEADILLDLREGSSMASALADFSESLSPERIVRFSDLLLKSGLIDDIIILED